MQESTTTSASKMPSSLSWITVDTIAVGTTAIGGVAAGLVNAIGLVAISFLNAMGLVTIQSSERSGTCCHRWA